MNPDPAPSVARRGAEILGVAAAYVATGKIALLLAIPPGYATAIWPPAGIALVALLVLGSRAMPGVFLGSLLVNLSTRGTWGSAPAIAAVIAAGASTQALVGAWLIRRSLGVSLELVQAKTINRFLLLGGPASCIVGATVGVAALYATQSIKVAEFQFTWWTWWVGDVIGVVVVAPLVLIAFGQPREVWRRRAVSVAIPLGILMALATALFVYVSVLERTRIASQLRAQIKTIEGSIGQRTQESVAALHTLAKFHREAEQFDRGTFRSFALYALSQCRSVQALSWNPRVTDSERAAFEQGGQDGREGPCRITERDSKDRLVTAPRRNEYFPVRYIEPHEPNASVIGFDVSSGIVRLEAMQLACDRGEAVATRRLRLMQDREESFGLIVFLPVYPKEVPPTALAEERRKQVSGYFAGVIRLDKFFDGLAWILETEGIDVRIHSAGSRGDPEELLWRISNVGETTAEIQETRQLDYWGRPCVLVYSATPAYVARARSWTPWGVLAAGMAGTGVVGAFLLAATGRAILSERNRICSPVSGV